MTFYDFSIWGTGDSRRLTAHGYDLTMSCVAATDQVLARRKPAEELTEHARVTLTGSEAAVMTALLRQELAANNHVWLTGVDDAFLERLADFETSLDPEDSYVVSFGGV